MSDNLYSIRKKYREQMRETEREYSQQALGGVADKIADIGSSIGKTAQDSFNRSMEAARNRREMEMQFAQEGLVVLRVRGESEPYS